jgi:hypothetical protein
MHSEAAHFTQHMFHLLFDIVDNVLRSIGAGAIEWFRSYEDAHKENIRNYHLLFVFINFFVVKRHKFRYMEENLVILLLGFIFNFNTFFIKRVFFEDFLICNIFKLFQ